MEKHLRLVSLIFVFVAFVLFHVTVGQQINPPPALVPAEIKSALDNISGDGMLNHVKVLASDEYEGRAPGTRGETLTIDYLVEQFKRYGLMPGNPNGTYLQKVPLVEISSRPSLSFSVKGKRITLNFTVDDYAAYSRRVQSEIKVENSEIVFAGYGVVAPDYGWDDYKGVDLRGKTVIVLDNDPQIPNPRDPSKLDDAMFKGRTQTYYGLFDYKTEAAAQKGAAAVLIVNEPSPSQPPFSLLQTYFSQRSELKSSVSSPKKVAGEGVITLDVMRRLCAAANQDFDALKRAALSKNFKPVSLGATADFDIKATLREIESHNVVAKIEGSDKRLKDEYVIYTAHWDHLGRDEKLKGDQIYNGAMDNAGGVAQLLEIAKGFAKLKKPPKRSILFIATTAEEKGLLGAEYYCENPLYPLARTLADINLDWFNPFGRTRDVINIGSGLTTLDEVLVNSAATQNRVLVPDPFPEQGYFFRSDQFPFARAGIPAVFPGAGIDYISKPAGYGKQKQDEYNAHDYHQVSDEVKPDWDMSGAVEDTQWLLQIGYWVAQAERFPEWKPGAEFKARREAMLKRAGR